MKIVTVIGARPQFIKASMVSKEIVKHDNIQEVIIHTGQHFDENMSRIFFKEMGIPEPDYNLGINTLSHGAMTGRMLESIENVLLDEKPDWVLVYGDANSTLAGALAASKLHISIAHVEAGLRSFNRNMPEEINRVLADHVSNLLFAPTETAVNNLKNEGITKGKIKLVGDVMYDAALHFGDLAEKKSTILEDLEIGAKKYILATVHRQENTNEAEKLKNIFLGLKDSPCQVILPLHPRTKKKIEDYNLSLNSKLRLIEPVGYLDMVMLEKHAWKIVTDSGGIQKEAYFNGIPCITMRDETEWVELVQYGVNTLVGSSSKKISDSIKSFMPLKFNQAFYGVGNTAKIIIDQLIK